jgi:hypothetical protein
MRVFIFTLSLLFLYNIEVNAQRKAVLYSQNKFISTDSFCQIKLCLINKSNDSSYFKVTIKPKPGYAVAVPQNINIYETNNKDSLIGYIWIVTPDIHMTEYEIPVYSNTQTFSKKFKISRNKTIMTLGIQLVYMSTKKSKKTCKYLSVPNDARLIKNIETIWLKNISINSLVNTQLMHKFNK